MTFTWPPALLLLALIPVGVYLDRAVGRRRRGALVAAGLAGPTPPVPPTLSLAAQFRRRAPGAALLAGLTLATVALARPQGVVSLPHEEGIVLLAFDVSGSMAATDLQPTRMAAAKAAATAFVQRQPPGVVVGVVAFSDTGISVQAPTRDQGTVLAAIARLAPQRGTSLGQGIQVALHTIEVTLDPPPIDYYTRSPAPSAAPTPTPTPMPAGTHAPAVIVLLTDGENNESPDPLAVAQAAAAQGVRIDTVGIGSAAGTNLDINGFQVHTSLDEPLLQQVAATTGGMYYQAADTQSLQTVYDTLDTKLVVAPEAIEVTSLFAAASVALLLVGGVMSLGWLGRLP